MGSELFYATATELLAMYASGDTSPTEVISACRDRCRDLEGHLNALVTDCFDEAFAAARQADERYQQRQARPLEGVPVLIKDNIDTHDTETTCCSAIFANRRPQNDAAVVALLRRAGAIVVGKTMLNEFAWGVTTTTEAFGFTRNPHAPDRTAGGSSGGNAAALAAGYAPLAIGSDTAGSIRIPAAYCGVTGLRPTFGTYPMAGVQPLAPTLDTVGPMARAVEDLALVHRVLTAETGPASGKMLDTMVFGVGHDLVGADISEQHRAVLDATVAKLETSVRQMGTLPALSLPDAYDVMGTTVLAEGLQLHRQMGLWPARSTDYGAATRERLLLAEHLDPDAYCAAQIDRSAWREAFVGLFSRIDVLMSPAVVADPQFIEAILTDEAKVLTFRRDAMIWLAPQSLTGYPACVLPAGVTDDGLPVGIQLTGRLGSDLELLDIAEQVADVIACPAVTGKFGL